jgi:hypothetical protein
MFNINNLYYTDKKSEMIAIGQAFAEGYDSAWLQEIKDALVCVKDWEKFSGGTWKAEEVFYKAIYDYWAYGFAPGEQAQYRLLDKSHEEKMTYISMNGKFAYLSRLNKKADMHILEDKYEAYQLLRPYYKREAIKIESDADYDVFLDFIEKHPEFVAKPVGLYCAIGVRKEKLADYPDAKALFNSLLNSLGEYETTTNRWSKRHAVVLEELIVQDKDFAAIHPLSINGVRITTVRIGDTVHIYYPWLKVGVTDNVVASAAQGGFDAGIDAVTGVLDTDGFLEDGSAIEYHPTTNVKIKGFQIPKWDEAISMAKEVAMSLPRTINYVGWDFVLTPKGWIVMEGNFYGDPMWQMYYQKGMKDDFEKLINWKPENKFWWKQNLKKIEEW